MSFNTSLSQQFEIARFHKEVDACQDINALKRVTKEVISAYFGQKAATSYYMLRELSQFANTNSGAKDGPVCGPDEGDHPNFDNDATFITPDSEPFANVTPFTERFEDA